MTSRLERAATVYLNACTRSLMLPAVSVMVISAPIAYLMTWLGWYSGEDARLGFFAWFMGLILVGANLAAVFLWLWRMCMDPDPTERPPTLPANTRR